jgi:hypothetical protein
MNWSAEPLYVFWCTRVVAQWTARLVAPEAEPEPSSWDLEKAANRLAKQVERVESGRWLPRVPYKLNGQAKKQLREAHALLHESRQVLEEAKR